MATYPEEMIRPMRQELVDAGFQELRTSEEVDQVLGSATGVDLVVINSVCGCAAGSARPGVIEAIRQADRPDRLFTAFAGNDVESTARIREHLMGYPPSSPSIAVFRDGRLEVMIQRKDILGLSPHEVADMVSRGIAQARGVTASA